MLFIALLILFLVVGFGITQAEKMTMRQQHFRALFVLVSLIAVMVFILTKLSPTLHP